MTDDDFDFNELDLAFTGRVPDAVQRVQQALAPLGVVGLIEGPQYLSHSTAVSVVLRGVDGATVVVADALGQLKSLPLRDAITDRLIAGIRPEVAFLNDECVYGTPRPGYDQEEPVQSWAVLAGPGLRAEHLVIASVKDRSARWRYWEENGCGFARYEGERRYHAFNFPADAGTVIALVPAYQDLTATIFARGQRLDMDFSESNVPITTFAEGSPAAEHLETLCAVWSGFTREAFEELGAMTGNARAAAELERTLNNGTGIQGLLELLRNLGIGRSALDYARNGTFPESARTIEPRGTLDRVRIVRAELERRTGTKPSFFGALRQLRSAR
ncbi:hypothetical protein ACFY5D_19645 [Paeniglutamicibacter sp. NPDC012692]|uniref:hypothetical protein n=1 Tax=Paeniglutamicibacter sp. NPDC012692 TaxID=3364388 RepID=UPI00368BA5AC